MIKLRSYKIFFLILIFISCSSKQKIENQIYDCLNFKIKKRPAGNSEDFFNYSREMELYSIKNGYLIEVTKDGYLNFFKNLYYQENQAKNLSENIYKDVSNDFSFNFALIYSFYKDCHTGLSVTDNETINEINKKLEMYDILESKGFDDYEAFILLINNTNFKSEEDRLMLFNIIQIFAYNRGSG